MVPATSARQGISLEPNTITPRVYPSVFPGPIALVNNYESSIGLRGRLQGTALSI